MSYSVPITPAEFEEYHRRVCKVREKVAHIGRGAQQDMSYDIRLTASKISLILSCRYVDFDSLALIEEWAEAHAPVDAVTDDLISVA